MYWYPKGKPVPEEARKAKKEAEALQALLDTGIPTDPAIKCVLIDHVKALRTKHDDLCNPTEPEPPKDDPQIKDQNDNPDEKPAEAT